MMYKPIRAREYPAVNNSNVKYWRYIVTRTQNPFAKYLHRNQFSNQHANGRDTVIWFAHPIHYTN